jgi:hypothetical protein
MLLRPLIPLLWTDYHKLLGLGGYPDELSDTVARLTALTLQEPCQRRWSVWPRTQALMGGEARGGSICIASYPTPLVETLHKHARALDLYDALLNHNITATTAASLSLVAVSLRLLDFPSTPMDTEGADGNLSTRTPRRQLRYGFCFVTFLGCPRTDLELIQPYERLTTHTQPPPYELPPTYDLRGPRVWGSTRLA